MSAANTQGAGMSVKSKAVHVSRINEEEGGARYHLTSSVEEGMARLSQGISSGRAGAVARVAHAKGLADASSPAPVRRAPVVGPEDADPAGYESWYRLTSSVESGLKRLAGLNGDPACACAKCAVAAARAAAARG